MTHFDHVVKICLQGLRSASQGQRQLTGLDNRQTSMNSGPSNEHVIVMACGGTSFFDRVCVAIRSYVQSFDFEAVTLS